MRVSTPAGVGSRTPYGIALGLTIVLLAAACSPSRPPTRPACGESGFPAPEEPVTPHGSNTRTGTFAGAGAPELRAERWKATAVGATAFLAFDRVVYAMSEPRLVALDGRSGRRLWERGFARPASLAAVGPQGLLLADEESVFLNDRANGVERWRFTLPTLDQNDLVLGAALAEELVVVTSFKAMFVLDAGSGVLLRPVEVVGEPDAPALSDGVVYVTGEHGETMAADPHTGKTVWFREDVGAEFVPPSILCDLVFLKTTLETVALRARTGTTAWQVPMEGADTVPAAADGLVYATPPERLLALDATSGKERWSVRGIGRMVRQPVLAGGTVYVAVTGRVLAIDTSTGSERARLDFGERQVADLAVLDDMVVVLLDGGELLAISD